MSPRPDVSEVRKNQILDAATDVFIREGLHKARVDDIAAEAGLSKGALYWYFKSKDEIVIAILDKLFEGEFSDLKELHYADGTVTERLIIFVESTVKEIRAWLKLVPITYEFLGLVFRQKIVKQVFQKYFRGYIELITVLIQQGIDQGEFQDIDAQEIAITIGAIIEGTIQLWVYDPEVVDVEKNISTGIEIFIKGLTA